MKFVILKYTNNLAAQSTEDYRSPLASAKPKQ